MRDPLGILGLLVAPLAASTRVVVQHLRTRSVSYAGDPPDRDKVPAEPAVAEG